MPADGLNVGTSTFAGGVSQVITKENLQRLSKGDRMRESDTPRRGIPPELRDPKYDAKSSGPIRSLNPLADRKPAEASRFPLSPPKVVATQIPNDKEQKVATTTGGDAPETPVVKGSAPLEDETPYREEGEGDEVGATEIVSPDSAAPSAPTEEVETVQSTSANDVPESPVGEPARSFVAEVETSKRSVVETTQSVVADASAGSNESDQGSGMPKRSVYTPPESASPPSGTHPAFKETPPEFKGWRALAAKLIAVVLGLYFGLQVSGLIASRSLTVACFVGVLMIMVNDKVGMIRQLLGGKFSKLAKPYSTFVMVAGVTLILTSLLVNYLMVELQPNWSQPLLDTLIR